MYKTYHISGLAGLGAVLFALFLAPTVAAVPLSTFIPFGQAVGDTRLQANDDGSSLAINLRVPFPFFSVPQQYLMSQGSPPRMEIAGVISSRVPHEPGLSTAYGNSGGYFQQNPS